MNALPWTCSFWPRNGAWVRGGSCNCLARVTCFDPLRDVSVQGWHFIRCMPGWPWCICCRHCCCRTRGITTHRAPALRDRLNTRLKKNLSWRNYSSDPSGPEAEVNPKPKQNSNGGLYEPPLVLIAPSPFSQIFFLKFHCAHNYINTIRFIKNINIKLTKI